MLVSVCRVAPCLPVCRAMSVSPFDSLADVERACCCHFLQTNEIISLARCSTRLLAQTSSAFAFRHAPLVSFHFNQLLSETNAGRSSSLLPFARSACRVTPTASSSPPVVLEESNLPLMLSQMPAGLSELELDLVLQGLTAPVIASILTHESCAKLRCLLISPVPREYGQAAPVWCDGDVAEAIVRLAHLTHLRVPLDDAARDSTSSEERNVVIPPEQHFPLRCEHLQHLGLLFSLTSDSAWDALFSVVPPRIESLALNHIIVIRGDRQVISQEHMRRAFASLTMMHTLTLRMAFDINALLPHLVAAPALRLLILDLAIELKETAAYCMLPSVVVMNQLLTDRPSLHCRLLMSEHISHHRAKFLSSICRGMLFADNSLAARVKLELGTAQRQAEVEAIIRQSEADGCDEPAM